MRNFKQIEDQPIMNRDRHDDAAQAVSPATEKDQSEAQKVADKKLQDPHTYEVYDEAMGELNDANSAASLGGPAV